VYNLGQLIDTLTGVVSLCVFVFGTKVAPLETVDRAKITDFTM
jgi:hypothetical protein